MVKAETTKPEQVTASAARTEQVGRGTSGTELRADLAAYHIQAAAALARQAKRIESENVERAFGNAFNPVFWNVSASVLMAWAALEANINKLIKTFEDDNVGNIGQVERGSFLYTEQVVPKYKGLARLKEHELSKSDDIFSNFEMLGEFRNALVDFQPEWHDEKEKHTALCKKMREILKPLSGMPSDVAFPFCHLGYECAKWAVVTATRVSAHYATLIGVEDHLSASWLDLELP